MAAPRQQTLPESQSPTKTAPAAAPPATGEFSALMSKPVKFIPFGEKEEIEISGTMVRKYLAKPTKSGKMPTDADIAQFLALCKARALNPWVGDAFLVGYDSQDGPQFNLITSIQALLKRAEVNPFFEGLEQGVIVKKQGGEITERKGDAVFPGETLLGAWAQLYDQRRKIPYYDNLLLSTVKKNTRIWNDNPAGMTVKCAQASVLRTAYPSQIGSLYLSEEFNMELVRGSIKNPQADRSYQERTLGTLTEKLSSNRQSPETQESASQAQETPSAVETTGEVENPWDVFAGRVAASETPEQAREAYDDFFGPESPWQWDAGYDERAAAVVTQRVGELAKKA